MHQPYNIVGYTTVNVDLKGQQKMVGANFISVGSEAVDLQDIRLVGDDGSEGASYIMWWDVENRTYGGSANFVNDVYVDEMPTGKPGWGDGETWEKIDKTFDPGEGFWFYPGYADVTICFRIRSRRRRRSKCGVRSARVRFAPAENLIYDC